MDSFELQLLILLCVTYTMIDKAGVTPVTVNYVLHHPSSAEAGMNEYAHRFTFL
jgi:hypothetical protein